MPRPVVIEMPPLLEEDYRGNLREPPAGKKTPKQARHVAFSDVAPSELSQQSVDDPKKGKQCKPLSCCFACCAWSCLFVLAFIIALLVLGMWFVSYLKSELPDIRVLAMSIPLLNMVNASSTSPALLDASAEVVLNVTNKNDGVDIIYSSMTADVSWENIRLGRTEVAGFSQSPHSGTTLKLATQVDNEAVHEDDAEDLQSYLKNKELVLDVIMNGTLGFRMGGFNLQGLPLLVTCADINQTVLAQGGFPKCSVRIFAVR